MKKLNAFLVSVLTAVALNAAVIEQVIVRQQWPWSTDIKVEYKLSGVTKPVDIAIQAFNGATELALPAEAITGDRYGITEDGVGTLVIDPVAAFGTEKVALANFKVKLAVTDSSANLDEVIYKILALDKLGSATCENVTRKDILNGKYGAYETDYSKIGPGFTTSLSDVLIWTGVTNDIAYKTTKLVLRKIPAAGKSFQIGASAENSTKATVNFAHDYWMGVFEVTAYQHRWIYRLHIDDKNNYKPHETNRTEVVVAGDATRFGGGVVVSDICPANRLSWSSCRNFKGDSNWPQSTHAEIYGWYPLGRMYTLTQQFFDLPTSAEWEFAARAGTTAALPSGKDYSEPNFREIGRGYGLNCKLAKAEPNSPNDDDTKAGFPTRNCSLEYGCNIVGSYRPNAYGLYDMMGNALEHCLDNYNLTEFPFGGTDPKGPENPSATSNGGRRVIRGGSYRYQFEDVGQVAGGVVDYNTQDFGYRICLHEVNK